MYLRCSQGVSQRDMEAKTPQPGQQDFLRLTCGVELMTNWDGGISCDYTVA